MSTAAKPDDWEEINFEFNSSVLTDGYPSLLRLAELLQKNPSYRVRVEGHADWIGNNRYNDRLGQSRANTVRDFLLKYGAQAGQVTAATRGEEAPKYGEGRGGGENAKLQRWMNRRVTLTVTDGQGRTIGAGGVGDAVRSMAQATPAAGGPNCCDEILKRLDRLDEIANLLRELKGENDRLRKDVDELRAAQSGLSKQVAEAPKPLTRDETTQIARTATTDAIEAARMKRFSILGINAGVDDNGDFTMTGRARYFAPFKDRFAVQAQGEFLRWQDRREGQFDLGLVTRVAPRFQAGLAASFKHVSLRNMQEGGTLGQGSLMLDYLFRGGRVGFFGTKSFMREAVVNTAMAPGSTTGNVILETYLRAVDQAGASATVGLWRNAYMEGNIGFLARRGGDDKPGGTIRLVQPITDRIAVTFEGGFNETLVSADTNSRFVAGLQFGNFQSPKEFMDVDHPVPMDIPRVRYEMLTRTIRRGNAAPVVDVGADQTGVAAGQITLDASRSFDPDGDPITFLWEQIAGPSVSLSAPTASRTTFTAAEGQTYSFRVTVSDDRGARSLGRTTVSTREAVRVTIERFQANPTNIRAGQSSTLSWTVENADTVTISGIGTVDPRSGSTSVSPTQTTTYTLTARNANSEITQTATVTVERPQAQISSFTAIPPTVVAGQCSTLAWATSNAQTVEISGVGAVSLNGARQVCPEQTTTYTLTAGNEFGQTTATQTITVVQGEVPRIAAFRAQPATILRGGASNLVWSVENATEVTISTIGTVESAGVREVRPEATTTYTLTARNRFGQSTATATVTVTQPPPPQVVSFTAQPATIQSGQSSTLTWNVEGATSVSISTLGTVANSGSQQVSPTATTTYTLTATNPAGQTTATATVTVTSAPGQNPTITACTASPTVSPAPGSPVQLTFTATNATSINVSGVGTVPVGQPVTVRPTASTTYTITATGSQGTTAASCSVAVTVTQVAERPVAAISQGSALTVTTDTFGLDGTPSFDPAGGNLNYVWDVLQGEAEILDQGKVATGIRLRSGTGTYRIRLRVQNAAGQEAQAIIVITRT
ncbi:MAG: OmpA family protein [Bryobacteraceae bacterium]|nr:OmpA family protein [Bryobacteraceae bacterium]